MMKSVYINSYIHVQVPTLNQLPYGKNYITIKTIQNVLSRNILKHSINVTRLNLTCKQDNSDLRKLQ